MMHRQINDLARKFFPYLMIILASVIITSCFSKYASWITVALFAGAGFACTREDTRKWESYLIVAAVTCLIVTFKH